jgi:hypothetical protein
VAGRGLGQRVPEASAFPRAQDTLVRFWPTVQHWTVLPLSAASPRRRATLHGVAFLRERGLDALAWFVHVLLVLRNGIRQFALRAELDGESVILQRGASARLGPLSIHLVAFDGAVSDTSDADEAFRLGIYRVR